MFKRLKDKAKQTVQTGSFKQQNGNGKSIASSSRPQESAEAVGPLQDALNGERDEFPDSPVGRSLDLRAPESTGRSTLPDFMRNPNAVAEDDAAWRHNKPPDYSVAYRKFLKERTNIWPPGSLEDLASNLIKNWKKEASHKAKLEDWRTVDPANYQFSCNGGRTYTADDMLEIGTSNALIQEAAFYSAKNTSFDDSHTIFQKAMPGGFCWEVTEVYSGPPVMAFKWRHWGEMTGNLVCPIGPDTTLEAEATGNEVEIWGICVAHLDSDFRISKLEVFYDPHDLMASLVDANNISYRMPDAMANELPSSSMHEQGLSESMAGEDGFMTSRGSNNDDLSDALKALGGDPSLLSSPMARNLGAQHELDSKDRNGTSNKAALSNQADDGLHTAPHTERLSTAYHTEPPRDPSGQGTGGIESIQSPPAALVTLGNGVAGDPDKKALPSDTDLLSALVEDPRKAPPGSRCPLPHPL